MSEAPVEAPVEAEIPDAPDSLLQLPPSASSSLVEATLEGALRELRDRSEVEDCVRSMIVDVELTDKLRREVEVHHHKQAAERLALQHRVTVQETRAMLEDREDRRRELADEFVRELWALGEEVRRLERWKSEHEHKVDNYDEMMAKLFQAEEELLAANQRAYGWRTDAAANATSSPPAPPNSTADRERPSTETEKEDPAKKSPSTDNRKAPPPTSSEGEISKPSPEPDAKSPATTNEDLKPAPSQALESIPDDAIKKTQYSTDEEDVPVSIVDEPETDSADHHQQQETAPAVLESAANIQEEDPNAASTQSPPQLKISESIDEEDEALLAEFDEQQSPIPAAASLSLGQDDSEAPSGSQASPKSDPALEEPTKEPAGLKSESDAVDQKAAVVEQKKEKEKVIGLVEIDVEVLMRIFGFLDAIDILNTAQINVTMYNRVDSLFGLSEDGYTAPAPTSPAPVAAAARPKPAPAPSSAPAPTMVTVPKQQPSRAAQPPQISSQASAQSNRSRSGSYASLTDDNKPFAAAAAAADNIGSRFFSMIRPRMTGGKGISQGIGQGIGRGFMSQGSGVGSSGKRSDVPYQPLNAAIAQSMAEKLSDAELAAIISLTEKLSNMEKEVSALRGEREEMDAKLEGAEKVKQFLVNKVRDIESKMGRSKEDELKITQQIASDQEVIAFLDSRVQELEHSSGILQKEKTAAETELTNLKVSSSKKITVLSDSLKYEKERSRETEGEWKATKKVLIKEVKSCRSQIVALQAERDGLQEQNDRLKRAITKNGGRM